MLPTTETALKAILQADPSISPECAKSALAVLKGAPTNPDPLDPIISPVETAKLCGGKDRHTLREWERRGWLVAVRTGKQGKNITGFTSSSVRAFLAGKANADGKQQVA